MKFERKEPACRQCGLTTRGLMKAHISAELAGILAGPCEALRSRRGGAQHAEQHDQGAHHAGGTAPIIALLPGTRGAPRRFFGCGGESQAARSCRSNWRRRSRIGCSSPAAVKVAAREQWAGRRRARLGRGALSPSACPNVGSAVCLRRPLVKGSARMHVAIQSRERRVPKAMCCPSVTRELSQRSLRKPVGAA